MMDWLGEINEEQLNDVKAEEVVTSKALDSAPYLVTVEQAFIRVTDSGASMFHIEGKAKKTNDKEHEAEQLSWMGCVRSGDEKGNKATYIDKNGKEQLLPNVIQVKHFFDAIGMPMATTVPSDSKVEYNGETINAKVFKKISGKKFIACVRQYENEYNGEIGIKYDIENFLTPDGNNAKGDNLIDAFLEKIDKSPIKKLRKKANATQEARKDEASQTGW